MSQKPASDPRPGNGRVRLSPSGTVGLLMLGVYVLLGVFGPLLAPYSPAAIQLEGRFAGPSAAHWLGTDKNGIDALSQLLWGARSALTISVIVVAASATIGALVGIAAGYFRGVVDEAVVAVTNILLAFPGILLNIAVVATVARPGLGVLVFAMVLNGWVGYARVVRGQMLSLRERDYVAAARSIGASHERIVFRHLLPNLMGPALVQMTFGFGSVILVEATLSFLGLGPQVDYTWGAMLDQGTSFLWREGFGLYAMVPGLAIMWVVLGANLLGDGLRDSLDPRQRGR
ncbi:MAG TPA: ABC transporter permease [Kofleriaceae bacterium]|nr:ABC transporter permease [Kofleriaceae bacterium]